MSIKLTEKRRAFFQRMTEDDEQAQWGFELILARADFAEFFDGLNEFGLFAPSRNPAPVAVDNGKYVQIPYWNALNYLIACAKQTGERNDLDLGRKIAQVLLDVTAAMRANDGNPDNFHTQNAFAEILGHLPASVVDSSLIDLIPLWLNSRYDRGLVARTLDTGLLSRLTRSNASEEELEQAIQVINYCTQIRWIEENRLSGERKKAVSVVEDHWLKNLIDHHAGELGARMGQEAADVFLRPLKEIYSEGDHASSSWLFRPAVENNSQNHSWGEADNRFVEGLRDALLAWSATDPQQALPYIGALLVDAIEMVRRVGILVLDQCWESLKSLFPHCVRPEFFNSGHLHEFYHLLLNHFASLEPPEKTNVVTAIRQIVVPTLAENRDKALRRTQRNWLSAIAGKGSDEADHWYAELNSDPTLGALSDHPDFLSYIISWWGPGGSSLEPEEIIELARQGSLVDKLNAFKPHREWRGPTKAGLVEALREATTQAPDVMLGVAGSFVAAEPPYQFALIDGFKRLWDKATQAQLQPSWDATWPVLIALFEELLKGNEMWAAESSDDEGHDLTPRREWIPPLISDILRAGTRDDETAYDAHLLPRTWDLIQTLVEKSPGMSEVKDDAMTQAINSAKGKALEALFSHALRRCRVADQVHSGDHSAEWTQMQPVLDREAEKARGANYEFSIIAAAYLANIEYLSLNWLQANIEKIFPGDSPEHFYGALAGLVFSPPTKFTTQLLFSRGIADAALSLERHGKDARHRLIERIAIAYLGGDEPLDSSRFNVIFASPEDLTTVSDFFWSVQNQGLSAKQTALIIAFWRKCMEGVAGKPPPDSLLSHLGRLTVFLTSLSPETGAWLEQIAACAGADRDSYDFVEQLNRLVDINADIVLSAFQRLVDMHTPTFDYADHYKTLILKLAEKGFRPDALVLADKLRRLSGMGALYEKLESGGIH